MANLIQIKRSETTATPGSLANGELAWAANGNILYIGDFGDGVVPIGGGRTPGTLTANQALVANSTSGIDKVIVANAVVTTITANGSVGTAGQVLVSNGTVSYWADPAASDFTLAADSGVSDTFSTGGTLTFTGGNGANTTVSDDTITIAVTAGAGVASNSTGVHVVGGTGVVANSTGVHIGQAVGTGDNVTFNDITATGNLNVTGTLTTIDTTNLVVQDPLIKLANGNVSTDALDIGFFGVYDPAGTDLYAGLFRDATDGKFKLFKDSQAQPTTTVDTGGTGYAVATLVAALESSSATITGGTITGITDLAVADGGTGASSFTDNGIIYGNGASALSVTSAGTEGQVLMAGSGGVPEFNTLDGGTF